jgi:hypothetical protein
MIRAPYRAYPDKNGNAHYYPFINVSVGKKRAQRTRPFEALVDSGASDCMFPIALAAAIGIKVESGRQEDRTGIGGAQIVWVHPVQLYVGADIIDINAAFAKTLPVAGILGRAGFFEHFRITFDPSGNPPGLELGVECHEVVPVQA